MMFRLIGLAITLVVASPIVQAATFGGYEFEDTCEGHAKGYKWAEENRIRYERQCNAVLIRHPTARSFVEGCLAYVDDPYRGYSEDDDGDDIDL